LGTELPLATLSLVVHDQLLCDTQRDNFAEVFFDQAQAEIEAGGNSRLRVNCPIFDADGVVVHPNIGIHALQLARTVPARYSPKASQEGSLGRCDLLLTF